MRKVILLLSAAALVVVAPPAQAATASPPAGMPTSAQAALPTCFPQPAIARMVDYIRTQQAPDGSFPSIGQSSTADAVYALVASGVDPSAVTRNGKSAIDWIYSQTGSLQSTGVAAKFLLALILAHRSTVAPNGFDFVDRVVDGYDPATGLYDPNPTGNAYALIALGVAGERIPRKAFTAWAALQQRDGGWSAYLPPTNSDTNTTAVAIIALVVNGHLDRVPRALDYFRSQQSADGGFTFSTYYGTESDANSTGLVTLALLVTDQDLSDWERGGVDPVERLIQLQNPSGAFRYSDSFPGDNAFATFQAGHTAGAASC